MSRYDLLFLDGMNLTLHGLSYGYAAVTTKLSIQHLGLPGTSPSYGAACIPSPPLLCVSHRCSVRAGKMDNVRMTQINAIQEWLMDPVKCPTECAGRAAGEPLAGLEC